MRWSTFRRGAGVAVFALSSSALGVDFALTGVDGGTLPAGTFGTTGTPLANPAGIRLGGQVLNITGDAWAAATSGTGGIATVTGSGQITGLLRAGDRLGMSLSWSSLWSSPNTPAVQSISLTVEVLDSAGGVLGVLSDEVGPLALANASIQSLPGQAFQTAALGDADVASARFSVAVEFQWAGEAIDEAFRFNWGNQSPRLVLIPTTCPADFNGDATLDPDDLGDYINCYFSLPACPGADFNADGSVDPDDLGDFINAYFAGC